MKRMVKKMGLLIVVLLAVFVVWKTVSAGESETEETESEGRMAVIHVVSIVGNELTYYEEETEAESEEDTGETESEGAREAGSESAESSTGEAENSEEGTEEAESGSTEETTGETGTETTGGNAEYPKANVWKDLPVVWKMGDLSPVRVRWKTAVLPLDRNRRKFLILGRQWKRQEVTLHRQQKKPKPPLPERKALLAKRKQKTVIQLPRTSKEVLAGSLWEWEQRPRRYICRLQ